MTTYTRYATTTLEDEYRSERHRRAMGWVIIFGLMVLNVVLAVNLIAERHAHYKTRVVCGLER